MGTAIVGAIFVSDLISNVKKKWWSYVLLFIFSVFSHLALFGELQAVEIPTKFEMNTFRLQIEHTKIKNQLKNRKLNGDQKKYYEDLANDHVKKGYDFYCQAQNKCMWFPTIDDKVKAQYCFSTALMNLSRTNPMSMVISNIINLFSVYGLNVMREWNEINTLLNYSKYHYEQQEFYTEVLNIYGK
jgi:hypothetical protein